MFACYGIPDTLVSDNGTNFVSQDFFQFLTENGIEHVQTAPKHPSSNGLAERAVQTVKHGIKKMGGEDIQTKLDKFLLRYRVTPQSTTGKTPSELFMKCVLKTRLDKIRPDLSHRVRRQQSKMSEHGPVKVRQVAVNEAVWVKNFGSGSTWLKGIVVCVMTPSMCEVKLSDGRIVRRHVDHVRSVGSCKDYDNKIGEGLNSKRFNEIDDFKLQVVNSRINESIGEPDIGGIEISQPNRVSVESGDSENVGGLENSLGGNHQEINEGGSTEQVPRRSQRFRQPPQKLKDYVTSG